MMKLWLCSLGFFCSSLSFAGVLASAGLSARTFAFQPLENESTPNYVGVGPSATFGYSFMQRFDLGISSFYTPGGAKAYHPGEENAALGGYGMQLGARISEAVYLGGGGGQMIYQSVQKASDREVDGRWEGLYGGIILGSIYKVDKKNYVQINLELMHGVLQEKKEANSAHPTEEAIDRSIDQVGLSITYTFNGFMRGFRRRGLFNFF